MTPSQAIVALSHMKEQVKKCTMSSGTPAAVAAVPATAPMNSTPAVVRSPGAVPVQAKFEQNVQELGLQDLWNKLHTSGGNVQFPVNAVHPNNATTNSPQVM